MKDCFCFVFLFALLLINPLNADTVTERDPTLPAVAMPAKDAKLEKEPVYILQSIIISPTRRLAVINGNILRVGDKLGEATVDVIDTNTVILAWPGRKLTLYLLKQGSWGKHT